MKNRQIFPIHEQSASGFTNIFRLAFAGMFAALLLAMSAVPAQANCGDGVKDPGEQCDDGNLDFSDACAGCKLNVCGDGYVCTDAVTCPFAPSGVEACDDGGQSAACDDDCTAPACGDGNLNESAGEACDDGNTTSGDGCRSDCASDETCGNGLIDIAAGETCDDGGESATCDDDCTAQSCGDGNVNEAAGEACDDGPTVGQGSCLNDCSGTQICGDTVANGDEGCDDGNFFNGDGCDSNCTPTGCPNGIVTAGEVCDDGNTIAFDGCSPDCLSNYTCGDGITNALLLETCDDGGESATCDDDCTAVACGDGNVNQAAGEVCDDGNNVSGDGCRSDCLSNETCPNNRTDAAVGEDCDDNGESATCDDDCTDVECGDGNLNQTAGEGCDDGNTVANDGCTGCVPDECGDGVHQPAIGEECDDGFSNSDTIADACRTNCLLPFCGDTVIDGGEDCDDGNSDPSDACVDIDLNGDGTPEAECVAASCGDGLVQLTPLEEQCDDGSFCSIGAGANRNIGKPCLAGDDAFCSDPLVGGACAERNTGDPGACRPDCTLPRCGDGTTDPGEECDNGGSNSDTESGQCRTDCKIPVCGDGITDDGAPEGDPEDCDDAGESATCDKDCTSVLCGDGVLNVSAGEACDDNNTINDDGCNSSCVVEFCGDGDTDGGIGEECDDGNGVNGDGCDANCQVEDCGDGDVQLNEECDDGLMNGGADGCRNNCLLNICGDGVLCTDADGCTSGPAGGIEECDDGPSNDDTTPDACRTDCRAADCGDGVTDTGEACDDAGFSESCNDDCTASACGDDIVNPAAGEECDQGGDNSDVDPDTCRTDCTLPVCGDTVMDSDEQCDSDPDCSLNCCFSGLPGTPPAAAISGCKCEIGALSATCDSSVCKGGRKSKQFDKRLAKIEQKIGDAGVEFALNEDRKALRKLRQADRIAGRLPKQASRQCVEEFECFAMYTPVLVNCLTESQARILEEIVDP